MTRKFFIAIIILPITCFAQVRLSLTDAVNTALKNSLDIQIARSNTEVAKINNNIGIAGGLPTITGTASDQESVVNINQKLNTGTEITRDGATSNNLNASVAGTMLLYNGYRVVATKKRLEEIQSLTQQQLNAQIQQTIATVATKYYDIVRQENYLKTLQQSIDLSAQQLKVVETRQQVGLANNADLFQSQIDLNTRMQDYESQKIIIEQAKIDLLNLINLKSDSAIIISDTIIVTNNIQLSEVLAAIEKNPDVVAADQQIKINQLIEKETAAQRYPSLRANSGINYGRTKSTAGQLLLNQSYGPYVGLSLSIPIYSGGTVKRQQQTAAINTKIASFQKQSTILAYTTNATKTFKSYISNIGLVASQQKTYQLSAQLVLLALQRFQLSQATIIEIREAQKSFEDAGYRLVNLSYAAKIAEIELKRITNQLGF